MDFRPRNGLSLCSGGGGLDMGLMLAEPGYHTRCFVEIEEYPCQSLIAAQRAGYFAPAPIWDDITTFDARPFAGAIDTLIAGYPCQPFSHAGQRKGESDERHLFPHVERIARELGPDLKFIFLENVEGHLTLGGETVLHALQGMDFTPAVGIFTAEEVGASHQRKRWFCLAYRPRVTGRLHPGPGKSGEGTPDAGGDGEAVDNPAGPRHVTKRIGAESNFSSGERMSGDGCPSMANASEPGPQGQQQPGSPRERDRAPAHGPAAKFRSAWVSPPGPAEGDIWSAIVRETPSCAPAYSRSDIAAAVIGATAVLSDDAAAELYASAGGMAPDEIARAIQEQAGSMVDGASPLAEFRRMADGLASRARALRLLGNGVHPLAAAYAFRSLGIAHGIRPVDMEATGGSR